MKILIKLGGSLLDEPVERERLSAEVASLVSPNIQTVIVHGGGKQMTRFLTERGIESRFVEGLRVTTEQILDAVLQVFAGTVNHQLVAALIGAGVRAVGLTGMDGFLTEAEQLSPELGFVGKLTGFDPALLNLLTSQAYLPVVACVAGNRNGQFFNVNADQMAATCAASFEADQLFFLTDVAGVRDADGEYCSSLTVAECQELIAAQVATGGMQAKLNSAIAAIRQGVRRVVIAPGAVGGILQTLLAGRPAGTVISA